MFVSNVPVWLIKVITIRNAKVGLDKKENKVASASCRDDADSPSSRMRRDYGEANTRFSEFLTGVLSKGVWWMP